MNSQPTFCPYAKDGNGSTPDDNDRLSTLFASIDQAKSARDARDAEMLAKLRRKHDIALDAVMQAAPSVTRVIAISDHLDAIRKFSDDPYRIWHVDYGHAGIIRDKQHDDTRICGIGLQFGSRGIFALLPEQEYDRQRCGHDVEHIHVKAGVYNISLVDDGWTTSTKVRPIEFANVKWNDMDMWRSYEQETNDLRRLAKALVTFESNYWCYACGVVEDTKEDAAGA